jgi:hypothetical protein
MRWSNELARLATPAARARDAGAIPSTARLKQCHDGSIKRLRTVILLAVLLIAPPGRCCVFVRWTEPTIPARQVLGVTDIVIPWGDAQVSLFRTARIQGYHVYAETAPEQAKSAAEAGKQVGLTGVLIKVPGNAPVESDPERAKQQADCASLAKNLRAHFPELAIRLIWPGGKEPQMTGTMVVKRDGVFAVSSPTQQPWIDSNVAFIRFEHAYDPGEAPLVEFGWDLTDSLEQRYGPPPEDYKIAIAEAGAFHADLILPLHQQLQEGLVREDSQAGKVWSGINQYIQFYARTAGDSPAMLMSDVGVLTHDYDSSYELLNLMARHNIPFRVIRPSEFAPDRLDGMALIVVFGPLGGDAPDIVEGFTARGGTAVLIGRQGNVPWHSAPPSERNGEVTVYATGQGRVVELPAPIADPESFARDVWRLLKEPARTVSLWNAETILVAAYQAKGDSTVRLNLVNYSGEEMRAQVRVKGTFSQIRYGTPEHGCCISLTPSAQNGFTEFVVPGLRTGGVVHLSRPEQSVSKP